LWLCDGRVDKYFESSLTTCPLDLKFDILIIWLTRRKSTATELPQIGRHLWFRTKIHLILKKLELRHGTGNGNGIALNSKLERHL